MAVGLYRQLCLEVNCKAMKGDVVFFKKWTEKEAYRKRAEWAPKVNPEVPHKW